MDKPTRYYWAWITFCCCLLTSTGCSLTPKAPRVTSQSSDGLRLRAIDQQTKAEACRLTALELATAEKDEHAIAQFEQSRQLAPNLKGIAHPLAVLYDRQGRLDAAQREYERALQEDPRNADVLYDYGYFLYSRGDFAGARQRLDQALARNAQHPKARINLAMVLAAEERYDEAFGHFEQALGPAAAHHNIGLLQMRAGRQQEAIAHLQQSAATDPSLRSDQLLATLSHTISPESRIMPVGFTQTQDETR